MSRRRGLGARGAACVVAIAGTLLVLAGAARAEPIRVAASIPPHAYFVERVAGDRAAVSILVAPGQSPHGYDPTPRQVAELADARLLVRVGFPFEETLAGKLAGINRDLVVVDARRGVTMRRMEAAAGDGPGDAHDEHGAGAPDPHIWLDPLAAKIQAATIAEALARIDPAGAETYRRNLAVFQADLDRVHEAIAARLAPYRGREVIVFHPAFGYFTDRYGLVQVPIEFEGKEPTGRQLAAVIDRARRARVKTIFLQKQYPVRGAQAVAEAIGARTETLDPNARDYLTNLEEIARRIAAAM